VRIPLCVWANHVLARDRPRGLIARSRDGGRYQLRSEVVLASFGMMLMAAGPGFAQYPSRETFTFKKADGVALEMDVYRAKGEGRHPVVLWIHGGALIFGTRMDIEYPFAAALSEAGCTIASMDYRLAPEAKLPEIMVDVRDAYAWVRAEGPSRFNADPDRVAVAGASAGGYLTLMAGVLCRPRPRALAVYYGYGDIVGSWLTEPSEHYRTILPLVDEIEANNEIGTTPIVNGSLRDRGKFYLFCRQHGIWPNRVLGKDPQKDPEAFGPYLPLKHIDPEWPPMVLIHGELDHDVPADQSRLAAVALKKAGIKHRLIIVPGADHGLAGASEQELQKVRSEAAAFVLEALR